MSSHFENDVAVMGFLVFQKRKMGDKDRTIRVHRAARQSFVRFVLLAHLAFHASIILWFNMFDTKKPAA